MESGWSESDSGLFARLGEVFTPGREEISRALLEHIPAGRGESFLAAEIGCGEGWLSRTVLEEYPHSRVLALDGSGEMLSAAGELLAPYGDRAALAPFLLEDTEWPFRVEGRVRCFLSSLVIHHLDGDGKRGLFRRLFERLEPGGALLYADLVEPRSEPGRRYASRLWEEEVRSRSRRISGGEDAYRAFLEERWNMYEHPDPGDKLSGIAEQLRWLEEAGSTGVDAPWVRAGHAVFCGYRPAA